MGDLLISLLLMLEYITFTNFLIICLEYLPHLTWYMYEHVYKRPKACGYKSEDAFLKIRDWAAD